MAENFYNAFRQGIEDARRDRSYNAFRSAYGDVAKDPAELRQLQQYEQSAQTFPSALEGQRLGNASTEQQIAASQQAQELNAAREAAQTQKNRSGALLSGALFIQNARKRDLNADVGQLFDRVAPTLGLSPEEVAQAREVVVSDPGAADDIVTAFRLQQSAQGGDTAAMKELEFVNGLPPDQQQTFWRLKRANADPEIAASIAGAQATARQAAELSYAAPITSARNAAELQYAAPIAAAKAGGTAQGDIAGKAAATLDDVEVTYNATKDRITELRALPGLDAIFGAPTITKAIGKGGLGAIPFQFPGTAAADAASRLEALKAQLRLQAYDVLRGTGPVSNVESEFAASAFATLDRSTSKEAFDRELVRLDKFLAVRMTSARVKAGKGAPPAPQDNPHVEGSNIILKWNPSTGRLE